MAIAPAPFAVEMAAIVSSENMVDECTISVFLRCIVAQKGKKISDFRRLRSLARVEAVYRLPLAVPDFIDLFLPEVLELISGRW